MWTTSSFRADRFVALPVLFLAFHCATTEPAADPESPRGAQRSAAQTTAPRKGRAAIEPAVVSRADLYPASTAPRELLRYVRERDIAGGIVVDVVTQEPIGPRVFDIIPAIVLNGRKLVPTTVINDQHLVAVAHRDDLRELNRVAITWLGAEETLTSKEIAAERH